MKVVYIAAPFTAQTAWAIEQNIRRAEEAGLAVAEMGASPLIPHANTRFFVGTCSPSFWYDATLALLLKADDVLMVGDWQSSKGATLEHDTAISKGIPVHRSLGELESWLHEQKRAAR